jgi:dipeptidyl aminopeptidase/acylaminoacyl peptidase
MTAAMFARLRPLLACLLLAAAAATAPALAQVDAPRPAGDPILLIGGEGDEFVQPAFSPDGALLAFTRPGYSGIWVMAVDSREVRQITDEMGAGFGFAWSPDGAALLARVTRFDDLRREDAVKVFDVASGEEWLLTEYRGRMPALPTWSASGTDVILATPDGIELFDAPRPREAAPDRETGVSAVVGSDRGLAVIDLREGSAEPLRILEGQHVLNAVSSNDGTRIAFEILGGDLHVINADGSGLIALGPGHRPDWSPDGEWIAFLRAEDDGDEIIAAGLYAVRADGTQVVALSIRNDMLEMNPSWSPDGAYIAFDDLASGAIYLLPLAR